MDKVLLIGAGALARDLVEVFGVSAFAGTFVEPEFPAQPVQGLPVLRDWREARSLACHYILAVLDQGYRRRARDAAQRAGLLPAPPMVAPSAVVAHDCRLAPGCAIGHFAVLGPAACLEEHVLVMHSVTVAHDVRIGTNTVLSPGARINGHVQLGEGCFVGANAVIAPRLTIGARSHIAAGAACFRDARPDSRLLGNPARAMPHSD